MDYIGLLSSTWSQFRFLWFFLTSKNLVAQCVILLFYKGLTTPAQDSAILFQVLQFLLSLQFLFLYKQLNYQTNILVHTNQIKTLSKACFKIKSFVTCFCFMAASWAFKSYCSCIRLLAASIASSLAKISSDESNK